MPEITLAEARAVVDAAPFARWWQLTVDDIGDGWATVTVPHRAELVRPGGVLHGTAYEVAADVALWIAIMSRTGVEEMAVTIEMKTSFLRGASTSITSRAEVLKLGRRIVFGDATTVDASGALVARSSLTYARA